MENYVNAALSVVVLLLMAAGLALISTDWVVALVPIGIVAIVYLNLDPLIALLNGPPDNGERVR